MQPRFLSVDYGERRIGLALSDPSNLLATPLTTLDTRQVRKPLETIVDIARAEEVGTVVVGYPYHTHGGMTEKAKVVDEFIRKFQALAPELKVERHDERYSTVAAHALLSHRRKKARRDKSVVDRFAAAVILQEYLDESAGRPV